ncbi:MAG: 50S ribosomal protein L5 [Patescibacteria group bacterium]
MNRLKQKYQQEVLPVLMKEFGHKNPFEATRILKVVVNMGVTDPQDPRARERLMPVIVEQFRSITGQHPQITHAKKSIANFKLRQGDPMGVMVTLRGDSMWEFLDRLISITLPRVKDFRGVSRKAFDGHGNYSLGIEEQIAFAEIEFDKIDRIRGLQVVITTSQKNDKECERMLELMGMPFEKEE